MTDIFYLTATEFIFKIYKSLKIPPFRGNLKPSIIHRDAINFKTKSLFNYYSRNSNFQILEYQFSSKTFQCLRQINFRSAPFSFVSSHSHTHSFLTKLKPVLVPSQGKKKFIEIDAKVFELSFLQTCLKRLYIYILRMYYVCESVFLAYSKVLHSLRL